jgi:hypothetical protein
MIYGPHPLENQNAAVEYGVATLFLEKRIAEWLDKFQDVGVSEPSVMGSVVALRVLAEAHPQLAAAGLRVQVVEQWRDRYLAWLKRHRGKIKASRGVSKDDMERLAGEEFDALIRALQSG